MLIDDITIHIQAGNGGDGAVAFNKIKMALGPTGARGGNGGSVYFEGMADLGGLNRLRNQKSFLADNGLRGGRQLNDGSAGDDLIIKVPVGTVIHNLATGQTSEIVSIGERVLGAKGGLGGRGNYFFRGPHNTSPEEFEHGKPGEAFDIRLELKLIADVGLIGLPNAGKSSLINELTRAKSKVGNYAFTTLEPHLGSYYGLILADIPGLIEGASSGKGLGVKFLKHIERTRILFHLISSESTDPVKDYQTIRTELATYNPLILEKEEHVFLSKTDLVSEGDSAAKLAQLRQINPHASTLSIHDPDSIKVVETILNTIARNKSARQ